MPIKSLLDNSRLIISSLVIIILLPVSEHSLIQGRGVAQAAGEARALGRLQDYKKIKKHYYETRQTTALSEFKLPSLGLNNWFGRMIPILSTHDVNRQKDIFHQYNVFIWQPVSHHAYLALAGKKLGPHDKLAIYNACRGRKITNIKQFKNARVDRYKDKCQIISALKFEEHNCERETNCKKNLTVDRYRKSNKYLLLYR